ncbi:MAG: glycosyltransferase family 4 protein [Pseudomonadota bacterium]
MKIAIYHGYELSGSGSNEYTRYLAFELARSGHEVVLICSDPDPKAYEFVSRAVAYDKDGNSTELFSRETGFLHVSLHQLPRTSVYPVYITDKQREGNVKTFQDMTDAELQEYHGASTRVLTEILHSETPQVLHANHLVYAPVVAAQVCPKVGIPYYIVPHGSSIEYTIRVDERFFKVARKGLEKASGVVWIAREVKNRVYDLYPDLRSCLEKKSYMVGVGTDTSLFVPVSRTERPSNIKSLIALLLADRTRRPADACSILDAKVNKAKHYKGGKTPAQKNELRMALDSGNISAMRAYWNAYDHELPDEDLPQTLDRIPMDDDLVLFVGAMTYGKGVQSLIAAMPAILAQRPKTHLILVGSGTYREVIEGLVHSLQTQNEELFDRIVVTGKNLERQTMSGGLEDIQAYSSLESNRKILFENGPGLEKHVHFLGRLNHPLLKYLFPCCQVAAFPSVVKEASPMVFAEALSSGVLPTGAYHSGLRDGLDDLKTYVPEKIWERMKFETEPRLRIQNIVDNLCFLLDMLTKEELGPSLRKLAEQRYDWQVVANNMVRVVRSLVG